MLNTRFIKNLMAFVLLVCIGSSYSKSSASDTAVFGMYQGNAAHTGYVPITINPETIAKSWQRTVGENASNYYLYPASIGKKNIIVTNTTYLMISSLHAFSIEDGHEVWGKYYDNILLQPPAYDEETATVWMQTVNNNSPNTLVRAYNEETGKSIHKLPFVAQWQNYKAPVLDKKNIYATTGYMSGLSAFDKQTGVKQWEINFNDFSRSTTSAVNDQYVVYYDNGALVKINKENGTIISQIQDEDWYENLFDASPIPVLDGEDAAFVASSTHLTRFNLNKDTIDYIVDGVFGTVTLDETHIYAFRNKRLTAINKNTGAIEWVDTSRDEIITSSPFEILITKNLIFVSDVRGTNAYSKTKDFKNVWTTNIGGKLSLSSKGLYIVSESGLLTSYKFVSTP